MQQPREQMHREMTKFCCKFHFEYWSSYFFWLATKTVLLRLRCKACEDTL